MDRQSTTYSVLAVIALGGWPLLVAVADVPLTLGALLYLALFVVVIWFIVRPMLLGGRGHA